MCVDAGTYGGSSDREDLSIVILIPVPSGVGARTSIGALLCDARSEQIRGDSTSTSTWTLARRLPAARRHDRFSDRKLLLISLWTTKNRNDTVGLSFLEEKYIVHFEFLSPSLRL